MKHLESIKGIIAFSLFGLMTACSSENAVVGNVSISDETTSDCKVSVSAKDTRPEYYKEVTSQKTTLELTPGQDNVIQAHFSDIMDYCGIGKFNVDVSYNDGKVVLILSPENGESTDCSCVYDADFKMEGLAPGTYQLEIYHTASDKKMTESNRIYQGDVTLESNKSVTLTMNDLTVKN
jgi:hypothetical protein